MKTKLIFILCLLLFLGACETVGYYSQSVIGHSKMMLARQPIDKAIVKSEGNRKELLILAKSLRQYAVDELSLPDNNSYLSYVDMQRKHPVWSIVAAPEFSIKPVRWCYPVVGCASYRGYFSEESAQKYAEKMRKKGLETEVGGVTAYSTLGWFNDPLIPSMLRRGEASLAEVMFHELAHQELYIKGNSAFNEAFATVVGEHGALRWLQKNKPEVAAVYRRRMQVRNDFSGLVKVTKGRLKMLYAEDLSEVDMRLKKQSVFDQFRQDYDELKMARWSGKAWYGGWLKTPLNNARMASFSTYRDLVPQFEALLESCGNNFERFYVSVRTLKKQGKNAKVPVSCVD